MTCGKFTVSILAIVVAMALVCQQTSAATSVVSPVVNGTSNVTLANNPAVPLVVEPVFTSSNKGKEAHLRVRRKGLGGIGGAVAGGLASGAALSGVSTLLGGRV